MEMGPCDGLGRQQRPGLSAINTNNVLLRKRQRERKRDEKREEATCLTSVILHDETNCTAKRSRIYPAVIPFVVAHRSRALDARFF